MLIPQEVDPNAEKIIWDGGNKIPEIDYMLAFPPILHLHGATFKFLKRGSYQKSSQLNFYRNFDGGHLLPTTENLQPRLG